MTWLDKYLSSSYRDGGRDLPFVDCYGLVRLVREEVFGKGDLPAFGHVRNTMPAEFTRCVKQAATEFEECRPEPGAVATVWRGRICVHIAIVVEIDGRLAVLDTGSKTGPSWSSVPRFEARFAKVAYFREKP
ncbi:hypothetical protein DZA07_25075 [Pseudomonas aeruginosa]|uniref:hypothetical protein n=1 Tax=Pseudomonas aeruginosa TaxID=287 RepID=UPI0003B97FFB|nr:hypothetical protein [Pseudomonas aeruginosa]ERY56330.1 hypothetical protein Q057_04672 [Pseudomonas aeruginosa BL03]KSR58736.1 hypothetical protein APB46_19935 [Pseudomonas aeruginosa]MBG6508920.1 hypothetical protein [Pseudomonas aeruginosa]MBH9246578.1 hypothetical protein [Pseudomonas aeruginosa]OFB74662.1 hypothetical protein AN471_10675 [Pseudomonas aeruginosa]